VHSPVVFSDLVELLLLTVLLQLDVPEEPRRHRFLRGPGRLVSWAMRSSYSARGGETVLQGEACARSTGTR
jgi:hypothetical protein